MCTCVERHRERAGRGAPSRYFRTSASAVVAIWRDTGGERDADERARRQPDALAQRRHRIQHGAGRSRQRAGRRGRQGSGRRSSAAQEPRAIGLPLDGAAEPAVDAEHVEAQARRFVGRSRAPAEQQAGALRRRTRSR